MTAHSLRFPAGAMRALTARLHARLSMPDDEAAQRRRLRVVTAAVFGLALLAGILLSALYLHLHHRSERSRVEAVAAAQASLLQERLDHALSATHALAAALRLGKGVIDDFDVLGSEILRMHDGLASVQLAPRGVISAVVPYVGNAAAVGLDLLNDPANRSEARTAMQSGRLTLAGPRRLVQGESAVIGRLPVYLPDEQGKERFWGFSSAVVRVADLLAAARLDGLAAQGYDYALAWVDPASGAPIVFAHAGDLSSAAPLVRTIEVPNGRWQLALAPSEGWLAPGLWIAAAGASLLFAFLAAAVTYAMVRQPLVLHRLVAQRTRALDDANRHLLAEAEERERAQREVHRSNRLYSVLSHTNSVIVRATSRQRLLDEVCRIAVDIGGFTLARIAMLDGEHAKGHALHWQATHGDAAELASCDAMLHDFLQDASAQQAFEHAAHVTCGELPGSEGDGFLCADATDAGFRSHIVLPLHVRGHLAGLFSLHAREPDAFDAAHLGLLEEMTSDIAFALENIEREQSRRRNDATLRKLSRAVEQSASAIVITDRNGIIEYVNPWFTRITGYQAEEVLGRTPAILRSGETHPETYKRMWEALLSGKEWTGELHNRKKNGELYWCLEAISPLKDDAGKVTHFVAVTEDISERKETERTIRHLAFHDPLTGLPNRRLFNDRLHQAVVQRLRKDHAFALALIDVDRFKIVNDTFGHDAGDALLKAIAARLEPHLHNGDTLARMGGDEFGLIAMEIATPEEAGRMAERMLQALNEPFHLHGQELYVSVSVGVTLFPHDGNEAGVLVRNADSALFHAKETGRNNYRFFTGDMNEAMLQRLQLENAMRHAIEREEMFLHFQPQVDIASGGIHGAEALVRWRHPELGLVSPVRFIPIAEETGMIVEIGEWILRSACAQAKAWEAAGRPLRVAVNLSARQLRHGDLAELVQATLLEFDLPAHLLELELTEGMLMEDTEETIDTLAKLHAMGVQLSIDDFGTGYSSLSYLKRLPIHILKIDQSFVRDIHHDEDDRAIVGAVIALAHSLKLKVIAEGVESTAQLDFLRARGCDLMQGYLFSRPVPGTELQAMLFADMRLA